MRYLRLVFVLFLIFCVFPNHVDARSIVIPYEGRCSIQVTAERPFYVNGVLIANGRYHLAFCQSLRHYTALNIDLNGNDSVHVVITRYRGNLYNRLFGVVVENYSIYKKSIDHYFSYNNHVLHSTKWRMHDEDVNPSTLKATFYIQTSLAINQEMDVLFQSLNGFFARNYLDCRLRTISNPQNGQCREVVLDTFISIPSLPPPPNAGEHLAHRSNSDQCTILVKSIHLYNFILLAHEFGHHYSDSSHCNDLGNCNEGPFPTSSLFLSRNYNIMDGEICTTMIQNINNASFDLNKIVGMNNTIAQCYEAQTQ